MRNIKIVIETGNAAFDPDPEPEIARILRELAGTLADGGQPTLLHDVNGNRVGSVSYDGTLP